MQKGKWIVLFALFSFLFISASAFNNKYYILDLIDQNGSDVNFNKLWANEAYIQTVYATDVNVVDYNVTGSLVCTADSNFSNIGVSGNAFLSNVNVAKDLNVQRNLRVIGDTNVSDLYGNGEITFFCDECGEAGTSSLVYNPYSASLSGGSYSNANSYGIAWGNNANANYFGIAVGQDVTAGIGGAAFGSSTAGYNSLSFGNGVASGNQSFAGGVGSAGGDVIASGEGSVALGTIVTASGSESFALGRGLISSGVGSIVAGSCLGVLPNNQKCKSSGAGSVYLGYADINGLSSGKGSIALGYNCSALNEASVCLGKDLTNYKANSVLVQDLNVAQDVNIGRAIQAPVYFGDGSKLTGISSAGDANHTASTSVPENTFLNNANVAKDLNVDNVNITAIQKNNQTGLTEDGTSWIVNDAYSANWNDAGSYGEGNLTSTFVPVVGELYKVSFDYYFIDEDGGDVYFIPTFSGNTGTTRADYIDPSGSDVYYWIATNTNKLNFYAFDDTYGADTLLISAIKIETMSQGVSFDNFYKTEYRNGEIYSPTILYLHTPDLRYSGTFGFSVVPTIDQAYDLGSTSKYWANTYSTNIYGTTFYNKFDSTDYIRVAPTSIWVQNGSISITIADDTTTFNLGRIDRDFKINGDNLFNVFKVDAGLDEIQMLGSIKMKSDIKKSFFGAGDDASIYYNGTDMTINPKEVGSGKLAITGDLNVSGDVNISGINADGAGKVVCIKTLGTLGTCTNQPNASGVCTCT